MGTSFSFVLKIMGKKASRKGCNAILCILPGVRFEVSFLTPNSVGLLFFLSMHRTTLYGFHAAYGDLGTTATEFSKTRFPGKQKHHVTVALGESCTAQSGSLKLGVGTFKTLPLSWAERSSDFPTRGPL